MPLELFFIVILVESYHSPALQIKENGTQTDKVILSRVEDSSAVNTEQLILVMYVSGPCGDMRGNFFDLHLYSVGIRLLRRGLSNKSGPGFCMHQKVRCATLAYTT